VQTSSRHSDDALTCKGLNLLRQQLALRVAVAQRAMASIAPAPEGAVSGEGEAVGVTSRSSNEALASQGLDLVGQQMVLRVAVSQPAPVSSAPAPEGAVGGDSEAVGPSSRYSEDAHRTSPRVQTLLVGSEEQPELVAVCEDRGIDLE